MARQTQPKVYFVHKTEVIRAEVDRFLQDVGCEEWRPDWETVSGGENMIEIFGRMCYRSYEPNLNPNVTRVRTGNNEYIANIVKVGHGSILEHVNVGFIFKDVSRVFTHELVRHRAGCAFSQESLRFVRLTDIPYGLPSLIRESEEGTEIFYRAMETMEQLQRELQECFDVDSMNFSDKKKYTSAFRRIAPIGLSTTIGFTCNLRALRHIIRMRTERYAEEEIRIVFAEVARMMKAVYPNVFADFECEMVDGIEEWRPADPLSLKV